MDPLETSKTSKSLAIGSKQIGKKTMIYILLKLLMATNILKKQKRNLQLMMIIIVPRLAVPMVNGEVVLTVLNYHMKQPIVQMKNVIALNAGLDGFETVTHVRI